MNSQNGNALFLILIAVALFAALSYAITNSGRGSANVNRERADIIASNLLQSIALMQNQFQRLNIIGGYDQVLFNDLGANASGTCYSGKTPTTPCNTIGLFSPESGLALPDRPDETKSAAFGSNIWSWQSRAVVIDTSEVGTTTPDTIIFLYHLTKEICEAINRKFIGSSDIGAFSNTPSAAGYAHQYLTESGTFTTLNFITTANAGLTIEHEGCTEASIEPGTYSAFFIIEEY